MKKLLPFLFLCLPIAGYSQSNYKTIPAEKLDSKKTVLAKHFIQSYLDRCSSKDYKAPLDYKVSGGLQQLFSSKIKSVCESNSDHFGAITLGNLNSAYRQKTALLGGQELYIFDTKTEKDKNIKYISVWISDDETIEGMVITAYKPFKKKQ